MTPRSERKDRQSDRKPQGGNLLEGKFSEGSVVT